MLSRIYGLLGACFCLLSCLVASAQQIKNDVKVEPYNAKKAHIKINPIKNPSGLPIKPERTIQFTTNEASWIDVDVSPDGKTLLCSFLGNLYNLPSTGGTATQLTGGLGINRHPVWSPDGKYFSYISDATGFLQIHIVDSTGNFHKVVGKEMPSRYQEFLRLCWLPDGKHICDGEKIYDLAGKSFNLPEKIKQLLSFSNEANWAYALTPNSSNGTDVTKFDTMTGEKKKLLTIDKPMYNLRTAKISPDCNWLTFIKYDYLTNAYPNPSPADSLVIIDLKTGKEGLLAHLGIKFTGFLHNQHYSFSKDSKYLFIGYGGKIHRIEISTGENEIIPFTANVQLDMGALDYHRFPVSLDSFEVKYIRSAQKSPDGKHLTFSALGKIYTMDLPNGKPHVLVDQAFGQFHPSYSPDGKWIAYISWSSSVKGHVWRIPSNGGMPEQITTLPDLYEHPSWSPDGKMIVVVKGLNSPFSDYPNAIEGLQKIEVINIEDKTTRIYADSVPLFNCPKFSKDGKQVIFKPNQNGSSEIWPKLIALDLQTKARDIVATALKKNENTLFGIRQIVMSPNGRYLVFVLNGDLYLTPIANAGTPQEIFNEKSFIQIIRFARGGIDANWEGEGKMLTWLNGIDYNSINPDKIMDAAMKLQPNKTLEGLPQTKIIDVDIPADLVITIHLKAPSLYGKGIIALKNADIITMNGQKLLKNGIVIIENGRIMNVGETGKLTIPKRAMVFDLGGKAIIPGLIDMHGHIGGATNPADVFNEHSWLNLLNLSYGVTTIRDPSGNFDQFGSSELLKTGYTIGSRLLTVGGRINEEYNLTSEKEAAVAVSNRTNMGATYIKQYSQPTRLQRELLLDACEKVNVNMTNEVEQEPLNCIGQIKDGSTGVEHNPVWGEVYDDVITGVASSNTFLCPTLQVCYGFEEGKSYFRKLYGKDFINRSAKFMSNDYRKKLERIIQDDKLDTGFLQQSRIDARIKHAGGKIVMGSHGEDKGIGAHWEIWALQMGGLTNYEALQTATITAAEALGMQKDLGSIEVGKIADLIILDKNPLEDIHNTNTIKYVMKAGVLYDSETLDEIWPEKKKCPEWRMKTEAKY